MFVVKHLLKRDGVIVGAELMTPDGIEVITRSDFPKYKDNLTNAMVISDGGIRATKRYIAERELLSNGEQSMGKPISKYTIMHENIEVVTLNKATDGVTVHNRKHLPFALRSLENISSVAVFEWIANRIESTDRQYMNMIYLARKVGRDRDNIISDSSGISFSDNFWIKTSDITITWENLLEMRDTNSNLSAVALTGKIDTNKDYLSGKSSLLTVKGHFKKAIGGGFIIKMREDAILEYPAHLLGKQLDIPTALCELTKNTVKIKIFTDNEKSLVHASELKKYYFTTGEIYNEIIHINRPDLISELQRMYIFNYLIGNPDLHDENMGMIYDSRTFELLSVSPCYDHNMAFQEGFNGATRTKPKGTPELVELDDLTQMFISRHPDIAEKLKTIDYSEISKYLSERQLSELEERIANTIKWAKTP